MSHEKRHSRSFCFQRAKNEEKPEQAPLQRISHKIDKESKEKLEKLFNLAHLVAKENLAMEKFAILCDLQEKNGLNIGKQYRNAAACKSFIAAIADSERNETQNEFHNSSFFSVLTGGSIDSGIIEQESAFV